MTNKKLIAWGQLKKLGLPQNLNFKTATAD